MYHIWFKESQPKINSEAYQIVKNLICAFYFGEMERNTFIFSQKIMPFKDGVIRTNKVSGRHFSFCTLEEGQNINHSATMRFIYIIIKTFSKK